VRVLHVSGGDLYGGIERMLVAFAATKSSRIYQQFAVSPATRLYRELRDLEADVVPLPRPRASRPLSIVAARREFGRLLGEISTDAVVFHGSWTHAMFAPVVRGRATMAFWQHAPMLNPRWPDRWASWTPPHVSIANSRFTASAPLFPAIAPHVIYCPVLAIRLPSDADRASARAELGAGDSDVVVLMAARLEAWKGHGVLIQAAVKMRSSSRVKFWIAGGVQHPSERVYLEDLQRQASGASNPILFLGQRSDVDRLMTLADVYCQPNTAPEPFGLAIAEAMRTGLPSVVSRSGGAAELVDRDCGVLVTPGDTDAVAAALETLAGDAARRIAMGTAARRRAGMLTDPAARLDQLASALRVEPPVARVKSTAAVV
jgi:glycosyltransferase involved in cell wall biosynthesis